MKIASILSIFIVALFVSCKKDLPEIGGTAAQKMANEWWVTIDQGGAQDPYGFGHFKIRTYNTAANNDSMWMDDLNQTLGIQIKMGANFNNLTFSVKDAPNLSGTNTLTITDGKVLLNAGHSRSGNVVDSIHMQVEFSDDPGNVYEFNGTARTRFIEDEY